MCLTPVHPIAVIFVLTGNIGGQGRGRRRKGQRGRTQEPEGRQRWGYEGKGKIQGWMRNDTRHGGVGRMENGGNSSDGDGGGREETNDLGPVNAQ